MNVDKPGLRALLTRHERKERRYVGTTVINSKAPARFVRVWLGAAKAGDLIIVNGVTLRRSFDMTIDETTLRFARVIAPATHRNLNSDLSIEGLREWGIVS